MGARAPDPRVRRAPSALVGPTLGPAAPAATDRALRAWDVVRWTPDPHDPRRFALAIVAVVGTDGRVLLLQIWERHGAWPRLQQFRPGCCVNPSYAYGVIERVVLHDGLDARECCHRWRENAGALERGEALPHTLTPGQLAAARVEYQARDAVRWAGELRARVAEGILYTTRRATRIVLPDEELETANAPEPTLDEIRAHHARCLP